AARGFFRPVLRRRAPRRCPLPTLPTAGEHGGQHLWPSAAYRQQLYDRAGADRSAGARREVALWRMVLPAAHPRYLSDQPRQHHAALVERSLSVDAAWRPECIRE